jgi:hypothetical protein
MQILASMLVFWLAFLVFVCCAYRLLLWKEYDLYKWKSREGGRHYNWLFFALRHQLDPSFGKLYGKPSIFKMLLIAVISLASLAVFADYVL